MSIRKNIFSALLFILWLALISFGTSVYYLNKIGTISTQILHQHYQSVKVAEEFIISLAKIDRALVMLCLDQDLEKDEAILLKIINSERKILSNYLRELESNATQQTDPLLLEKLRKTYQQYERNLIRVATTNDRKELYLGGLRWQSEVLRFSSTKVVQHHHQALDQSDKALEKMYRRAKINIFLATIFVLLIAAAALDKLPSWVIRPIVELTERVKAATQRDTLVSEHDIQVTPTSELAGLADSIQTTQRRLRETEEKFWLITDNLYDIIFFCGPNGNIFYTTPSIQRVLGYEPEEVVGSHPRDLLHPDNRDRINASGELIYQEMNSELRLRKKDGTFLWVEVSYISHSNEQGETAYTQYTARDISDRKRDEEKFRKVFSKERRLNEELTRTNNELDQLVYSASHNLRAPLTSVLGLTSLLRLATDEDERLKLVDLMESSIHALDETIGEITDYSRNERAALTIEPIDFEEITVEAIRNLQLIQSSEHPVAIDYQIDSAAQYRSDPQRLKTIFVSLGANAIKYCNPNQATPALRISVVATEKEAVITFEDNGIGIKPELQSKVFDMFYRASEQATGAGLGLYIVKNTVAKLKGTISLHSVLEEGTKVVLTLPSLKSPKARSSRRSQQPQHS